MIEPSLLELEDGRHINYKYIKNNSAKDYLIFYIHGYSDSMKEAKSMKIEECAKKNKIDLIKFDLFGHGNSSGKLVDMTMDEWYNCCKIMIERIVPKKMKIVFMGSSLGGWLSYILGEQYKDRARGIIGVAGAIDFFTDVIEPLVKEEDKNKELVYEMVYDNGLPSGDFVSRKLIESSKKYNMLNKEKIDIICPIRLIHGLIDPVVPYTSSIKFIKSVVSQDVKLYMEKNLDHDLTKPNNLDTFEKVVDELVKDLN